MLRIFLTRDALSTFSDILLFVDAKHAWYWEAVVMLRKVSMVMIDVVLGPSGVAVQALVALLMMSMMFQITSKVSPFEEPHILRLELISLFTSFLTLWLGSFFWATDDLDSHEGISVLIVLINVFFLLYLFVITVGDSCRDYKVVEKTKDLKRKMFNRLGTPGSAMAKCCRIEQKKETAGHCRDDRPLSLARVVPIQHEEQEQQQKSTLKNEIAALK